MPVDQPDIGTRQAAGAPDWDFDVVLKPIARPGLGDIRVDGTVIMGRTEPPFLDYPHDAVRLLSRKHARIECTRNGAYLTDLGSRNGTTVNGSPVQQDALKLANGDEICLGGELTFRIDIQPRPRPLPTGNSVSTVQPADDKTRFVDAPMPFLRLFSPAGEAQVEVPAGSAMVLSSGAKPPADSQRQRLASLVREFAWLDSDEGRDAWRRHGWKAAVAIAALVALAVSAYIWNAPERNLKQAIARGEYAQAAVLAYKLLNKQPDDIQLQAQAIDATLKANVPAWLAKLKSRDFDGAEAALAAMSRTAPHDAGLQSLLGELTWVGNLERLIADRGGAEAPLRIYSDEERVERLVEHWNDNAAETRRALAIIAAHVPEFADEYGEALSRIRRLQSESAVYLPVIQRVKADIDTQLQRDDPEALQDLLAQAADKYPGLGGLADAREDLARYLEIRRAARTPGSGRLFALLRTVQLRTPPFQQSLRELTASGQLPSAELQQAYAAATLTWEHGDSKGAIAELEPLTAGPWGPQAAAELERRRRVAAAFAALDTSGTEASIDPLLAFIASLDANEDAYFARAAAADLKPQRDNVIARAKDSMGRARSLWQEYRDHGAISAAQRAESAISAEFRARARRLAQAREDARIAFLIYTQFDVAINDQWSAIRAEIEAEAVRQRQGLDELSNVLTPELLNAKRVLIGEAPP